MNVDYKDVVIKIEETILGFLGWAEKYKKHRPRNKEKYLRGQQDIIGLITHSILGMAFIQQKEQNEEYTQFVKMFNDYYATYKKAQNVIKTSK